MNFVSIKNSIVNYAVGQAVGSITSKFNSGSQKDSGKVAAQLLKKSGMDIPDSPDQGIRQDPLSFSFVHYPIDLTSNELGHYILFESGFVGYSPQTSTFTTAMDKVYSNENVHGVATQTGTKARDFTTEKITAKLPSHSITTSGIALYMPPGVKTTYAQSYDQDIAGLAGDVEVGWKGVKSAQGAADKIEAALKGIVAPGVRQAKQMLGNAISLAGAGDPITFAAKRAGLAMNPRNEMFYNSPEMRNFTFIFDFWPRNEKEAKAMENIIGIFKYNSAPGLAENTLGGVFTIPNYWKISYMHNEKANSHLNKIGACYCTSVDIDYSPDGQWTTQADGTPVHTKLTLGFVEDRILTKSDIEAGA